MSFVAKIFKKQASVWVAVPALLGSVSIAHGQAFECARETVGQLSVQAGVRCQCAVVAEGAITGAQAAYAWDCGVLRGRMNGVVPAAPGTYQAPLIDGLVVWSDKPPAQPSNRWRFRQP
jgi:hypothetical protein